MKKTTKQKKRFNLLTLSSPKPLAAMTLLTALALPMSAAKAQTPVNGQQTELRNAIANASADNGTVTIGKIT
ncbi:MAG: hypothetical protein LBF88_01375, partial [Planctomycetaceae bacterium]|nr:hypothetical protein [Planctomycetaceae bacterium]